MLRFCYSFVIAVALSFGCPFALGWAATLKQCDLSNGLAQGTVAFQEEVQSCLYDTNASELNQKISDSIWNRANAFRVRRGLAPLEHRTSLNEVASAHVRDMIARKYASHFDLEGRGHVHRIRLLDRTALIGASGANITIVKPSDNKDLFKALIENPDNERNLLRSVFTHMGVGVARAENGDVFVALLFLHIHGNLTTPLPGKLEGVTPIKIQFRETNLRMAGWTIESVDHKVITRGIGRRIVAKANRDTEGFLTIQAQRGDTHYILNGPAVSLK